MKHDNLSSKSQYDLFESDPTVPPPSDKPDFGAKRPLNILIADDNAINRSVLRTLLMRMGYRPVEASNGAEALDRFHSNPIDLIFLDIDMPEMTGIEVAKEIRSYESSCKSAKARRTKVEIVAVTANPDVDIRKRCQEAGMSGFIAKPINDPAIRQQLLKSWKRIVTRRKRASS